jgi:hypothetical protein
VRAVLHFAPSAGDPYVRVVFPRPELGNAKELAFDIYVPGSAKPYTQAVFSVKALSWKGSVEY